MVNTIGPVDAVATAPSYSGRMLRQLGSVNLAGATPTRPLGAYSGIRPGSYSATVPLVTATSTTWTVNPHAGVIDAEAPAEAGPYGYSIDAAATGAMRPADAFARIDLVWVRIDDPAEDTSGAPAAVPGYTYGTVAATPPATPARCMVLAQISVPASGGGSPTVTMVNTYAVAAGGITPGTTAVAFGSGQYTGQYLDDPAGVLQRWNGTSWSMVAGRVVGKWGLAANQAVGTGAFSQLGPATPIGTPSAGLTNVGGAITVAVAGEYEVSAAVLWSGPTSSSRRNLMVTLNCPSINGSGVPSAGSVTDAVSIMSTLETPQVLRSQRITCAAGDTLRVYAFQDSGGTLNVEVGSTAAYQGQTVIQAVRVS